MAAPVAFAALVGTELNALGVPVHLHEFDGRDYQPSLTLDAR